MNSRFASLAAPVAAFLITHPAIACAQHNEGSNFGDEAKSHSQDSRAKQGGAWGWIDEDTFSNPLSAVAFAVREGSVSHVVESRRAFHLVLVEERRKGGFVAEPTANAGIERGDADQPAGSGDSKPQ